ncbi:MAG: ABC transporter ATP-binding protein [bacterium]|nr:ABC transporter ATP-binding protein [bacterium]MDO8581590.1 ABC transporter ATP-binding protein [bacterium]
MYSSLEFIKDIARFVRPYRWRFLFASLVRLSADIVYLYAAYALSHLITALGEYTTGKLLDPVWFFFMGWSIVQLYRSTAVQIAKYVCYQLAERVQLDSQLAAFNHLQLLDIAWHEKENAGNKMKRVQSGGEGLDRLLRIWIDNFIEISVNFLGMIVVIAFINTTVALLMFIFLVTYLCISLPLARRSSDAARVVNQHEEDFSGLGFEIMNNIRTVKVMGMFDALFARLDAISKKMYAAIVYRIYRYRIKSWAQAMWSHGFRIVTMLFIIYGIVHGRYEVSFFILFNFYFNSLRASVDELSDVAQDITIARYNIFRLKEILDEKLGIDDDTNKVGFPSDWKKISLQNVSFSYGNNPVLRNISFDIKRGEKIGIVGLSGVGKSTLFKLLFKEYENFTGDILFDTISIRKIKKSSYFKKVAVVLQDTEVFNFSLRDNITIASVKRSEERLAQALEVAHVNDFMQKLPQGIDTLIGEKGIKLSGGEKQRLGIARAIFKQPDILFLDEATSHLDVESEEKIQDSLHQFFKDVTAIVIAHRLTTIKEMDRILLIEDGELRESGSFKTLHRKRGRFYELWEKQKL